MIFVTGATGNVGRQVVEQLVARGEQVRGLSRTPEKANLPESVQVVADLAAPGALDGVDRIFLGLFGLAPVPEQLDVIKRAGVRHVVFLSSSSVLGPDNAIARHHREAEQAIIDSGLDWTFVRPGGFMANALQWAPSVRAERVVRAPYPGFVSSPTHEKDIAAVAVAALVGDGHRGAAHELTGPEALSYLDMVHLLGTAIGEDVRFEEQTEQQAREAMGQFVPAEIVDSLMSIYHVDDPAFSHVLPTITEVTGRPALTFRQWAADHVADYR
ncbi:NAD(P)H-binding protein [Kutzneria viridogrisea]|uniref:NAD(P)-binding domain-containing protein n=2 Tax=Kutzneria TaxID=43356 RepID=W5WGE4_9PSEU|nr:NAD(P)H-binding protein [Kutzneria albida]AHH99825.1 hypothetical protein KALB_6466 [Kutzneria albida DSM 43870]MBA8925001.1 uncharacterized protein YbjT (DUF2867 family) [Kutzneria viridogrisea]